MKTFLLSALVLGSLSAMAEVKPRGTVLADFCGYPSKTLTVCTATAVGTNKKFITLSTVKSHVEVPVRARILGPGIVLYTGTLRGKKVELATSLGRTSHGKMVGTYKVDGQVVGLAPFTMEMQFHTQGL